VAELCSPFSAKSRAEILFSIVEDNYRMVQTFLCVPGKKWNYTSREELKRGAALSACRGNSANRAACILLAVGLEMNIDYSFVFCQTCHEKMQRERNQAGSTLSR
jgi:hypothetical protein